MRGERGEGRGELGGCSVWENRLLEKIKKGWKRV